MSGFYVDMYVLCPERTDALAQRFLAAWAPGREPSADEYEIPQYSDTPAHRFAGADDAILSSLARSVGARSGYVTVEEPPAYETQDAFRAECARRELALIDDATVDPA